MDTEFMYSHGRADIFTTQLGVWAYEGKSDLIFDGRPINWEKEGTGLLYAAILGNHAEIARKLLAAGSPVDFGSYMGAHDYFPEFLNELLLNPEFVAIIDRRKTYIDLNFCLMRGETYKLTELLVKVKKLKLDLDEPILLSHGIGSLRPIEYTLRKGDSAALALIINAGANINFLKEGKSLLRIVLESDLEKYLRRDCSKILKSHGVRVLPPPSGLREKIKIYLNWRIAN